MSRKVRRQIIKALQWSPLWACAYLWRGLMFRTTFVAVTGSLGKTAAKDCLAAMLSRSGPTVASRGNENGRTGVIKTILQVRPRHRYAVIEAGTELPGNLWRASLLIRPDIALILGVARTHTQSFKNLEEKAKEKSRILRFLRRRGTAVLNADDPRVAGMAKSVRGRVVRFGSGEGVLLRHTDAESVWPGRLSFMAESRGDRVRVETQMIGTHRVTSVAGALAVAVVCGVRLLEAAEAVHDIPVFQARLQPAALPSGAWMLRDEYNGSIDSFEAAVRVLREAKANRRILVISDCGNWDERPQTRQRHFARTARDCADAVIFVGERSEYGVRFALREGMPAGSVRGFLRWEEAAVFLKEGLQAGDLVLLRGLQREHLTRIYFSLLGSVECHKANCTRHDCCDSCPELGFRPDPSVSTFTICAG